MNLTVFIVSMLIMQLVCLYIGGKSAKGMKDQNDYFLAGKGIRFFPLMMTFLATQVGGGLILGSAEEAYQYGWSVLFYPVGAALGLILLGLGIGRRLAMLNVTTTAQILEVVYKSAALKKIASLLSIVSLFMILIAQIIASNKFMLGLGVETHFWFFAFWGIVIVYTVVGGMKAVVATDIIQAAFFVAVFLLTFGYVWFNPIEMTQTIATTENFIFDSSKLWGWLLMPLLFIVIEQDMGMRCFAGDCPKTVSKATLWAGIITLIVSVVPVFFGVLAKNSGIAIAPGSSVLMSVIQQTTTPVISALVACAILVAIVSTADALINAISSNLSQDFDSKFFNKEKVRIAQITSAVIAVLAIAFSFYSSNIVGLLIQSYELSVSCLFIPTIVALFKKEGNTVSAALAVAFGAASFLFFRVYPNEMPKEVISVLISGLGFCVGELVASYQRRAVLET